MEEQNKLNNDDNNQSFNNPQKSQYNYLFVSEQHSQNEYNIENYIPFSNEQLNNQFLSSKRKKSQKIFTTILYIIGLLLLLFDIFILFAFFDFIIKNLYDFIFFFSLLIVSILDIILASINLYYTKKYQNSRNICASIISGFIFFILVIYFYLYFYFTNIILIILNVIIFLNFIFSIILFFFNSKSKCCKCFN